MVCCAAAIGGDNLQDLKTGRIVGATPWKQQVMQIVGVLAASVVMMPVLWMLHRRYGIGMDTHLPPELQGHALEAPQAGLMANIARGVFNQDLPWNLVAIGAILAVAIICLDKFLERRGSSFRAPVLAVAIGTYLPFHLTTPILLGGLISKFTSGRSANGNQEEINQKGLLFASGLITGEALVGILLAVPLMLNELTWLNLPIEYALFKTPPLGPWPGVLLLCALSVWFYKIAKIPNDSKNSLG